MNKKINLSFRKKKVDDCIYLPFPKCFKSYLCCSFDVEMCLNLVVFEFAAAIAAFIAVAALMPLRG